MNGGDMRLGPVTDGTERHVFEVDVYKPSTVCICGKSSADRVHIPNMRFVRGVSKPSVIKEDK